MSYSNQPVISVSHLTRRYGTGRIIYSDLSFDVPRGRILGLLGKNGTGKTTTINILMGYLKPQQGECRIFGEPITEMKPETRARIALLIEGHVQYPFMTISQIEKFYSHFYKNWNRDAYYELMKKLHVTPDQHIFINVLWTTLTGSTRTYPGSNADLLVLDDFSLGLDPGYRRLFVEYLHEYAKAEDKTVFMTSHIIQDLERLIDDCIILDYGKILTQTSVDNLLRDFSRYTFTTVDGQLPDLSGETAIINPSVIRNECELYTFEPKDNIAAILGRHGVNASNLTRQPMTLEDAFIGLTGKY